MALIICKNCGKKVSDTAEKCVHCGTQLDKDDLNTKAQSVIVPLDKTNKIKNFNSLTERERINLEKEFLSTDEKSKRYFRQKYELFMYARVFLLPFILIWGAFRFFYSSNEIISTIISFDNHYIHFALITFTILGALGVIMSIVLVVCKIRANVKRSHYVYLKKFQKWLMVEKNIEYIPRFKRYTQQYKFDNVNIEEK